MSYSNSPVHWQGLGIILKSKSVTGKGMLLHALNKNLTEDDISFCTGC